MEPGAFGQYAFLLSWVAIGSTLGALGLDTMLVKYLAIATDRGEWSNLKGALRWARWAPLLASLALGGLLKCVWPVALARVLGPAWPYVLPAACLLILGSMGQVQQAALRGLQRVVGSQVPEGLIQPLVKLAGVLTVYTAFHRHLGVREVLLATLVAAGIGYASGAAGLGWARPGQIKGIRASYALKDWTATSLVFLVLSGLVVLNGQVGTLMMGMKGARELGVYVIIQQVSSLIPFGMIVMALVSLPGFATLHAAGDREGLQRLLTSSTRLGFWISGALVLGLAGASPWLLPFLRVKGACAPAALAVLALGQLANVAFGPVANLLMMTGHEREVPRALALALVANAGLCLLLVPPMGVLGAALASTVSLLLWNLKLAGKVSSHLSLRPTLFCRKVQN